MSIPTINTDKLFAFLRKLVEGKKLSVQDAHEASNEIYNMAAINTIERFGSRLDALNESSNAKLDTLNESQRVGMEALERKYNSIIWIIGAIGGAITLLFAAMTVMVAIIALG